MALIIGPGGVVEGMRTAGRPPIPEAQRPQSVDGDCFAMMVKQLALKPAGDDIEHIDRAVAKVAD